MLFRSGRPAAGAGDAGYRHPRTRRHLAGRGVKAAVPRRGARRPGDGRVRCDRGRYRRRNAVGRCVSRLREDRRVGTRHERLAAGYLAVVQVACVRAWLKALATGLSDTP